MSNMRFRQYNNDFNSRLNTYNNTYDNYKNSSDDDDDYDYDDDDYDDINNITFIHIDKLPYMNIFIKTRVVIIHEKNIVDNKSIEVKELFDQLRTYCKSKSVDVNTTSNDGNLNIFFIINCDNKSFFGNTVNKEKLNKIYNILRFNEINCHNNIFYFTGELHWNVIYDNVSKNKYHTIYDFLNKHSSFMNQYQKNVIIKYRSYKTTAYYNKTTGYYNTTKTTNNIVNNMCVLNFNNDKDINFNYDIISNTNKYLIINYINNTLYTNSANNTNNTNNTNDVNNKLHDFIKNKISTNSNDIILYLESNKIIKDHEKYLLFINQYNKSSRKFNFHVVVNGERLNYFPIEEFLIKYKNHYSYTYTQLCQYYNIRTNDNGDITVGDKIYNDTCILYDKDIKDITKINEITKSKYINILEDNDTNRNIDEDKICELIRSNNNDDRYNIIFIIQGYNVPHTRMLNFAKKRLQQIYDINIKSDISYKFHIIVINNNDYKYSSIETFLRDCNTQFKFMDNNDKTFKYLCEYYNVKFDDDNNNNSNNDNEETDPFTKINNLISELLENDSVNLVSKMDNIINVINDIFSMINDDMCDGKINESKENVNNLDNIVNIVIDFIINNNELMKKYINNLNSILDKLVEINYIFYSGKDDVKEEEEIVIEEPIIENKKENNKYIPKNKKTIQINIKHNLPKRSPNFEDLRDIKITKQLKPITPSAPPFIEEEEEIPIKSKPIIEEIDETSSKPISMQSITPLGSTPSSIKPLINKFENKITNNNINNNSLYNLPSVPTRPLYNKTEIENDNKDDFVLVIPSAPTRPLRRKVVDSNSLMF